MALQLEGNVDNRDQTILELQDQVTGLEAELDRLRKEKSRERSAILRLRQQLLPFYQLLQAIFGVIDSTIDTVPENSPAGTPARSLKWDSWKQKMPGKPAEFIELLLVHGEMSTKQLVVAARCAKQTVYDTMFKLSRAGLAEKNGDKYRLKEI